MSSLVDRLPSRTRSEPATSLKVARAARVLSASICDISNFPTAARWNCQAMPRSGRDLGADARVAARPPENNFVSRNRARYAALDV